MIVGAGAGGYLREAGDRHVRCVYEPRTAEYLQSEHLFAML